MHLIGSFFLFVVRKRNNNKLVYSPKIDNFPRDRLTEDTFLGTKRNNDRNGMGLGAKTLTNELRRHFADGMTSLHQFCSFP